MAQQTNPLITSFSGGVAGLNNTTYLGGVYATIVTTAVTTSMLAGSPVGFDGTIDSIFVINGDATKGTLLFSKNGTQFATIVKNGTSGAMTGTPLGSTTFVKTDVLNVQNVGTDTAEIIVNFH